jgi:hypothetical protein
MPLIKSKSKKAVSENISTEMDAGKPQKQSIAIALDVQRRAKGKKKFALGGAVEAPGRSGHPYDRNPGAPAKKPNDRREPVSEYMGERATYGNPPARKPDDHRPPKEEYMADHFAEGGEVEEHYSSIADAILAKKRVADSQVDLVDNSEQDSNNEDRMSYNALHRPIYDEEDALDDLNQPEDSNEHGHELSQEDDDSVSIVDKIRRGMKSKRS